MKKNFFLAMLLSLSLGIHAQVLNWNTDITTAITISNEQKKPLLILFTDTNDNKILKSQILETLDFALWSRDNVVLVKLDLTESFSNQDFERNQALQKAFGVRELPQICLANASMRKNKVNYGLYGKIGYKPGGVKSWIESANKILSSAGEEEE